MSPLPRPCCLVLVPVVPQLACSPSGDRCTGHLVAHLGYQIISTRILGRRTAPFSSFLIPNRMVLPQDPSTNADPRAARQEPVSEHNVVEFGDKDGDGRLSLSEFIAMFDVPTNLHDPSVSAEVKQEHTQHIETIKVRKRHAAGTIAAPRASTKPPFKQTAQTVVSVCACVCVCVTV